MRKRELNNFGGILDNYQSEIDIAMNKLFVFQNNDDPYKLELETAYAISSSGKKKELNIRRLNVDYLIKNRINVVIATELPKEPEVLLALASCPITTENSPPVAGPVKVAEAPKRATVLFLVL